MIDRMPIRATGIAWYRRQDYPRILRVMDDAEVLPPTWEKWHYRADRLERDLKRRSAVTLRAVIDPDDFPAWCAAQGLNVDAHARNAFAAEMAARQVKDTH